MATTAPFGAAMSQASPLLSIHKLTHFLTFFDFFLNYFDLVSIGDSTMLITGSADQTAKIWNVQTGEQLFSFNFGSPARAVDLSVGDKLAVITTDPFMDLPSAIHVKSIAADPEDRKLLT